MKKVNKKMNLNKYVSEINKVYNGCMIKNIYRDSDIKETKAIVGCHCGKEFTCRLQHLKEGSTKSCGCLKTLLPTRANLNLLFLRYKRKAKNRNYNFTLTKENFEKLTSSNCFYCGKNPENVCKQAFSNGDYIYNGIDRVDNSKGYTIDNCVPCCFKCNSWKGAITLEMMKKALLFINTLEIDMKN